MRRPRSTITNARSAALAAAVALGLIALGHGLLHAGQTIDDAAISYAYARNLALGRGFVFQPGDEVVEGATNLLWVLLLAAGSRIGLDPEIVSKALGLILTAGTVMLIARFPGWSPRHPDASPDPRVNAGLRLFAALLVALAAPVAFWGVAGLETALFGFLLLAGCAALVAAGDRREWTGGGRQPGIETRGSASGAGPDGPGSAPAAPGLPLGPQASPPAVAGSPEIFDVAGTETPGTTGQARTPVAPEGGTTSAVPASPLSISPPPATRPPIPSPRLPAPRVLLPLAFVLLFGAALTRPEGLLYLAVAAGLGVIWGLIGRWGGKGAGGWWVGLTIGIAIGVAGVGALTLWRLATFTYPLPNTYYAKAAPRAIGDLVTYLGNPADPGWGYLARFAAEYPILPAMVLVLVSLPLLRSPAGQAVVAFLGAGLAAIVYEGGDNMVAYRFLAPLIPFGALAVARAIAALTWPETAWGWAAGPGGPRPGAPPPPAIAPGERVARPAAMEDEAPRLPGTGIRFRRWPLLLAVPIGLLWILPNLHRTVAERVDPLATYGEVRSVAARIDRDLAAAGIVAPTVLTPDIGGFADVSDRLRVVDLGRLVDTTLAHQGYRRPVFPEYIFDQRRPTLIRTHHHWTTDTRLIDEPAFATDYLPLRRWTDGGAAGGEWLRRDALLSADPPGESQIVPPPDRAGIVPGLELRGWEDVTLPGEAGRRRIWLYWTRTGTLAPRPDLTIRLIGAAGRPAAQIDHTPTGGLLPPGIWPEGRVARDFVDLPLLPDLPAGEYELTLGPAGSGAGRPIGRVRLGEGAVPAALRAIDPALDRGDLSAAVALFRRIAAGRDPGSADLLPILDRLRVRAAALVQTAGDGRTAARLAAEVWPFSGWGRLPDALGPAADRCAAEAVRAAGAGDLAGAIDWQRCATDLLPADAARRHDLEDLRDRADPRTLPALPAEATPVSATFGRRIRLLGYAIDPAPPLAADRPATLHLYFDTVAPVTADYEVYVHLESAGGRTGADHYPPLVTSRWRPGEIIPDRVTFALPPGTTGPVAIWVGLWDRRDSLPVTTGPVENDGQRVHIADVAVRPDP